LRKIVRGGADDSYGIEVAALAGIPKEVIQNAKNILQRINDGETQTVVVEKKSAEPVSQLDLEMGMANELVEELKRLDVTTYTPIEALNKLYELTNKAREI